MIVAAVMMAVVVMVRVIVCVIMPMDMIVAIVERAEVRVATLDALLEDATVASAAAVLGGDLLDRSCQDHVALAVEQQDVCGKLSDHGEVVADEHDGDLAHVPQAIEQGEDIMLGLHVHGARGLVEDEHRGLAGERSGHEHALLLPLAQVGEHLLGELRGVGVAHGLGDRLAVLVDMERVEKGPAAIHATAHHIDDARRGAQVEACALGHVADAIEVLPAKIA